MGEKIERVQVGFRLRKDLYDAALKFLELQRPRPSLSKTLETALEDFLRLNKVID